MLVAFIQELWKKAAIPWHVFIWPLFRNGQPLSRGLEWLIAVLRRVSEGGLLDFNYFKEKGT